MTEQIMTEPITLKDIMLRDIITLAPDMEILKAMDILLHKDISGAPVLDKRGQLVGILSGKDCLKVAFSASYHQEWGGVVSDFMSTPVETLDDTTTLIDAAQHFLASAYRRFPVTRDGRLVGQVSRVDILKALKDQW